MARSIEKIAADLESLKSTDFDGWEGRERLEGLCEELLALRDRAACAPVMFRTMERLHDADLGLPGPLVHTLETWRGDYEPFLVESIRRRPTPRTLWMVNRILNGEPADADAWVELLRSVVANTSASAEARAAAVHFLEHQGYA